MVTGDRRDPPPIESLTVSWSRQLRVYCNILEKQRSEPACCLVSYDHFIFMFLSLSEFFALQHLLPKHMPVSMVSVKINANILGYLCFLFSMVLQKILPYQNQNNTPNSAPALP